MEFTTWLAEVVAMVPGVSVDSGEHKPYRLLT